LTALVPERFGTARVRHVLIEGAEAVNAIFRGLVGGYGRIVGAPALAAFIAVKVDAGHQAALGFHGEQVILEAASRGLASCWVAGSFRRDVVRQYTDLAEGEEVLCVTPIGREAATTGMRRLHDESMHWFLPNRGSRKPLTEFVTGEVAAPWLRSALEAARWAPSAVNRQPWRFTVAAGDQVSIGYDGAPDDSRALDCGIAMANFAAMARAQGAAGCWAPAEVPALR
jgi:nitroreductase